VLSLGTAPNPAPSTHFSAMPKAQDSVRGRRHDLVPTHAIGWPSLLWPQCGSSIEASWLAVTLSSGPGVTSSSGPS
jgi:hypothetical protein